MRAPRTIIAVAIALIVIAAAFLIRQTEANASGYFVSPSGADGDPGTISRPWRTVKYAVGRLSAGDTLYLRAGTYFERPTVSRSGTATSPIVIRSYPGETAILDSGVPDFRAPGNADWQLVNAALGEYRSVRTFALDEHVYAQIANVPGYGNGRVALVPYVNAAAFRSTSEQYVDSATPFYIGPGTFWDSADQRFHIRLSKTADMRYAESRYGTVLASENADPRQYSIILSHAYSTLTVSGAYLVFKDLTVNQALNSVYVTSGAHDLVFDGVTVWLGDSAIEVITAHHILITRSRIYGDAPYWVFWSDMKDAPAPADLMRATSIDLRSGAHHVEISYCHIRGSGQDLVGMAHNEHDVSIHHCRLENAGDDAFEIEGTTDVGRVDIFENYILNCLTSVAPGQDTPSFTGPLFCYRNVIAFLRNPPINRKEGINTWNGGFRYGPEYMFKHGNTGYTTRNCHYYHNTLVLLGSGGKGINFIPKDPTNCRIANNIAVTINGVVNRDYRAAPGEVVDGNLYWKVNTVDTAPLLSSYTTVPAFSSATGFEVRGIGSVSRRGTDPGFPNLRIGVVDRTKTVWQLDAASETPRMSDFRLRSGSPALGAGITIPAHPQLGVLPDTRSSRDIGAIPFTVPASEYEGFPFVPDVATDVTPPARPGRLRTR